MKALSVYLSVYQMVPYERLGELWADLLGASVSAGLLQAALWEAWAGLAETEATIREGIRQAPGVRADETGLRIAGARAWLHVACTESRTHYGVQAKRGHEATEAIGLLPAYEGCLVHDAWSSYFA
jgi:hypothetical protein